MELIRRLVLFFGLAIGLWLCASPASKLYRVEPVDPVADKDRIARAAKDGLVSVSGGEWEGLFKGVVGNFSDKPIDAGWAARKGRDYVGKYTFFAPGEKPVRELAMRNDFEYVQIKSKGQDAYVGVTRQKSKDTMGKAPVSLLYPGRPVGAIVLLVSFLAYCLMPWPKKHPEGLRYSRTAAGTVPDGMAMVLFGMFYTLPLLIPRSFSGDGPFDEGWIFVTGAMWLLALICGSMWVVSANTTSCHLDIYADGLLRRGLLGNTFMRYDEVLCISTGTVYPPKWLTITLTILTLFSWRAFMYRSILQGDTVLRLRLKDGRVFKFTMRTLMGVPQFLGRMQDKGVVIDGDVWEAFNIDPTDPEVRGPFSKFGSGIGAIIATVIFGSVFAWFVYVSKPAPALVLPSGGAAETPFKKPSEAKIDYDAIEKHEQEMKKLESIKASMDQIEQQLKTASPEEKKKLDAEYERLTEEMLKLGQ